MVDQTFKHPYASKIFSCSWQTVPNFDDVITEKILTNIYATLMHKQFVLPVVKNGGGITITGCISNF